MLEALVLMLLPVVGVAAVLLLGRGERPRGTVLEAPSAEAPVVRERPATRWLFTDCSPLPSTSAPSQHGQLLFALPLGAGRVGLDCLLAGNEEPSPAGLPVHLVAKLPTSVWMAEIEQDLVQRWLSNGDPVDVDLCLTPTHPRVTLGCDRTTLMLPVTAS